MPKFRRLRKFSRTFLNVSAWMGWSRLKVSGKSISDTAKRLFIPQKATYQEEFDDALTRLNLSEADLMAKQSSFFKLSVIFVCMSFVILGYAIYLAWGAHIKGAFVSLCLTFMVFAIAFRYHFWYFQVKQRKLGCSLRDWYYYNFAKMPPPTEEQNTKPPQEQSASHE